MHFNRIWALALAATLFTSGAFARDAWDAANDPLQLDSTFERRADALPTSGALNSKPWSDTYWPSYVGGIANRWQGDPANRDGADRAWLYGARGVNDAGRFRRDPSRLNYLSPAERFDVLNGDYNYSLLATERNRISQFKGMDAAQREKLSWEGICHGWAPAALQHAEPNPVTVTNRDGIAVPFRRSDITALISWYYANKRISSRMLGTRCEQDVSNLTAGDMASVLNSDPSCRDTNAGSFHLILTNFIGIKKQGFVADVDRSQQVWNQPIYGYQTRFVGEQAPGPRAAAGTVKEILVQTRMAYTQELAPSAVPFGEDGQNIRVKDYQYSVEINSAGEIIGGEWISDDRPDFLWTTTKADFSAPGWENFKEVLRQSGAL